MRSGISLGRKTSGSLVFGALALALSLTGCGTSVSVRLHAEAAKTKKLLAGLKCPRTTLTIKELGETFSVEAWSVAKQGFKPVYRQITEADAFQSDYLREIQERRRGLFARQEKIKLAERRQAQAAAERERKRKAKIDARAAAKAKRAEAVANAELAPAVTAPGAAPTSPE